MKKPCLEYAENGGIMKRFEKLFEPGKIGKVQLKNRIIMPAMGSGFATEEGYVTDQMINYYTERARGGCGLITVEGACPHLGGQLYRPNIGHDKYIPGLTKLVEAIHKARAKAAIQFLAHKGRADRIDSATASEVIHPKTGARIRALSVDELQKLVDDFGKAAKRAKEAGFDCIEIHGASGYLISEFLSPRINKRTDDYGGDLKKRAKLALDSLAAAKEKAGADFTVIYKMVADERVEGGFGIEDAIAFAKLLEEAGADAIEVVSGAFIESYLWLVPYMYIPHGCNNHLSQAIKKEVKMSVCVAGKILDPYLAEATLRENKADFIAMGRALIADPWLPNKAMTGRTDDICGCVACLRCVESIVPQDGKVACTVNPAVGREKEFETALKPAIKKKKVLVIGGGPGGMEAAIIAAQRGHQVTLWEKNIKLGGQLNLAVMPPGKDDLKSYIEYLTHNLHELKVAIKLGTKATAETVLKFSPNAVLLAAGSSPLIPQIKGIDRRRVVTYIDVLSGKVDIGNRVIVVGGGFVGCELADFLADKGKKVTVIEILPQLASEIFLPVANLLAQRLKEKGVQTFTEVKEEEITDKGIEIIDKDRKRISIKADDVVIAAGAVPDKSLIESLNGQVPELYKIGDCVKARRILEAVREGATAGMRI